MHIPVTPYPDPDGCQEPQSGPESGVTLLLFSNATETAQEADTAAVLG